MALRDKFNIYEIEIWYIPTSMIQEPKYQAMSIVFLGNFNPKIFQPAWFVSENLIKEEEQDKIDNGNLIIIDSDLLQFRLPDWLLLRVVKNRFQISVTNEAFYEEGRDLVYGTFKILKHTPISKMGINLEMHFQMESEEKWHALGDFYAPKKPWEKILKKPGLSSLIIEEQRPDKYKGFIRVKIEPTMQIVKKNGVLIDINDHFETSNPETNIGCAEIIEIFEKSWEKSLKRSKDIIYNILRKI